MTSTQVPIVKRFADVYKAKSLLELSKRKHKAWPAGPRTKSAAIVMEALERRRMANVTLQENPPLRSICLITRTPIVYPEPHSWQVDFWLLQEKIKLEQEKQMPLNLMEPPLPPAEDIRQPLWVYKGIPHYAPHYSSLVADAAATNKKPTSKKIKDAKNDLKTKEQVVLEPSPLEQQQKTPPTSSKPQEPIQTSSADLNFMGLSFQEELPSESTPQWQLQKRSTEGEITNVKKLSLGPRVTEADSTKKDETTTHRKLDKHLYLVVKNPKTGLWDFPLDDRQNGEPMLTAAKRAAMKVLTQDSNIYLPEIHPIGYRPNSLGGLDFVYQSILISGTQAKQIHDLAAWLTGEELAERLGTDEDSKMYLKVLTGVY